MYARPPAHEQGRALKRGLRNDMPQPVDSAESAAEAKHQIFPSSVNTLVFISQSKT